LTFHILFSIPHALMERRQYGLAAGRLNAPLA